MFSLSLLLWATLGENICIVSLQQDCNLENKRRNFDETDFKMGVAATLPELSEWILSTVANMFLTLSQAILIHMNTLITTSQALPTS